MLRLLIGSKNPHKIREISELLKGLPIEVVSTLDYPEIPDVLEDEPTLEGNAAKKALQNARYAGCLAVSDDTGLFVEALHGDPGVYSARYAGEDCTFEDNRNKLLEQMHGQLNRRAFFRTVVVLASPEGVLANAEGIVEGEITSEEHGEGGFGYDPIFRMQGSDRTFAELTDEEKNAVSHRGLAFRNLLPHLKQLTK